MSMLRNAALLIIAGISLGLSNTANAALMYDLKAASGTGYTVSDAGKTVTLPIGNAVGTVINLQLWATVTGLDANETNDGFMSGGGSILGDAAGLLKGNMSVGTNLAPFTYATTQAGTAVDLNGDTYLDMGSTNTTNIAGYFWAVNGITAAPGTLFELGTFTYTVATGPDLSTTHLTFRPREKTGLGTAIHKVKIDGTEIISYTATNPLLTVGMPIDIEKMPEPATLSLLALGGLAMLRRKRRIA